MDNIVCLDACFTQKHCQSKRDPPHNHPASVFLSEADVKSMEEFVDSLCSATGSRPGFTAPKDGYEGPLKVPNSVLDECEESFIAADEMRQKASTQFFSDTGVMALLCHHDCVLWLANMTSAGERQYYALALLQRLFEHLPLLVRIGVLYDIGCKLH